MFENELDNQGAPSQNTAEMPLFENYEMKAWNVSPRVYKILGLSALLNLVAIFGLGQSNLLTVKGCDSPLIGSVCQVLDTVYVGAKLYGEDSGFIDADYEKSEISEADITYLDLTGQDPPLTYPADYWQIANPERFQNQPETIPGIDGFPSFSGIQTPTSTGGAGLENKPQELPKHNDNPVEGQLPPGFGTDVDDNVATVRPKRGGFGPLSHGKAPKNSDPMAGFPQVTPTPKPTPAPVTADQLAEKKLNKRPGYDFAYRVLDNQNDPKQKIDLSKTFVIELNGVLNEEGRLDAEKSKFIKVEGDEALKTLAKDAIKAIDEMGVFFYLQQIQMDKINFVLEQNDDQIFAVIKSDQKTERMAGTRVRSLSLLLEGAKGLNNADEDTLSLLNASSVSQDGKFCVMKFALKKDEAQALIQRQLQKAAVRRVEEQKQQQNNGSAQTPGNTATGIK
jgi:hypothetical protein